MKKETLQRLINEYSKTGKDGLAEHIAILLELDEVLKKDIKICNKHRSDEQLRHKQSIQELNSCMDKIQTRCPHYEYTYHEDPSGNNDDYYSCDLCGKEWG